MTPAPAEPRGAIVDRVRAAGVVGCAGRPGAPLAAALACGAELVVAHAADAEPLLGGACALLAEREAHRLVRGLGAAMVGAGARRGLLVVRAGFAAARARLARELAGEGAGAVELRVVPDVYPADDEALLVLEASGRRAPPGGSGLQVGVLTLPLRTALAVDDALELRPVTEQWVAMVGDVACPTLVRAAIGTPIAALVEAAGGPRDPGWVPFLDGPLSGRRADRDEPIGRQTRGVVILPLRHDLVLRRAIPLEEQLRRGLSACERCQSCTDHCPPALLGAPLAPHRIIEATLHRRGGPEVAAAALCTRCGACELACPVGLSPRAFYRAYLDELGDAPPIDPAAAGPIAEGHVRRRLDAARVVERLALGGFERPLALVARGPRAPRLALPLERAAPRVRAGARVVAGEVVAGPASGEEADLVAPVHAPRAGRVVELEGGQLVLDDAGP